MGKTKITYTIKKLSLYDDLSKATALFYDNIIILLGLDYIMKTIKVKKAFPMHFWKKYDIYNTLQKDERSVNYRNCVVSIQHMNELFVIKEEEV